MITGAAWAALLMLVGFGAAQADAIARYSAVEASPERGAYYPDIPLEPCADSRLGESLLGVTQALRRELHYYTATAAHQCVPPMAQAAYLAFAFPRHYPRCAARFARGELGAFRICWGQGHGS